MFKSFTERAATPPSDGIPTADYAAVPANMTAPVRESSSSASKFAHRMSTGMSNTMSNTVAAIGTNLASIELASISPTRSYDDSLQIGENGEFFASPPFVHTCLWHKPVALAHARLRSQVR